MAVIDEACAWDILHQYVADCKMLDPASLLAVYAIGSLAGGYYRPGQSDIDAILIVTDGSEAIWGTPMAPSQPLEALNQRYLETYQIPKDFGPFPIAESQLYPPYDPEQELVPEIARLKLQGKRVYGSFDLDTVPMPSSTGFLQHVRHFEEWWRDEFSIATPLENMSAVACVNTVLMHLGRFLWIERDIIEFDKRQVVRQYLEHQPPFVDQAALDLVARSLAGHPLSGLDIQRLRKYTVRLREQMNAHLRIM